MAAAAVPVLERAKEYEQAIELLRALLAQTMYCPHSRGSWWDRCAFKLGGYPGPPARVQQLVCLVCASYWATERASDFIFSINNRPLPIVQAGAELDAPHAAHGRGRGGLPGRPRRPFRQV